MSCKVKEFLAVLLSALGAVMGLFGMFHGEQSVAVHPDQVGDPSVINHMIQGLEMYCTGIGLIFLLAGIAYILVGQEEQVSTVFEDTKKS